MWLILIALLMKLMERLKSPQHQQQQQQRQRQPTSQKQQCKLQQQQQQQLEQLQKRLRGANATMFSDKNSNKVAWQHIAMGYNYNHKCGDRSNSSSTSSGCCDSNGSSSSSALSSASASVSVSSSSSKENRFHAEQNHAITPEQLQELRHYQRMQQQQLELLQQQLLQRRRLQQQLRAEGVLMSGEGERRKSSSSSSSFYPFFAGNQQYLQQQKQKQQKQQLQLQNQHLQFVENNNNNSQEINYYDLFNLTHNKKRNNYANNYVNYDDNNNNNNKNYNSNYLCNNSKNSNNVAQVGLHDGLTKGQKFRRGMTEFSTNNEIIAHNNHLSQPQHNSPHHQAQLQQQQQQQQQQQHNRQHYQQQHNNSPQHHLNHHRHGGFHHPQQTSNINDRLAFKQTQNHKNNQQTLTLNSSANIDNNCCSTATSPSPLPSATQSPLHYKKPLNSPNNSPFVYAYYSAQQLQQQHHFDATTATPTHSKQQQQQPPQQSHYQPRQQLRLLHNKLSQTNYQQHLNDLLLQQQHLQQQQQHLLSAAGSYKKDENGSSSSSSNSNSNADELSDECLKQNVAIVLSNLDRYNNALRSIILNEQVSNSLFDDSVLDFSSVSVSSSNSNNNFLLSPERKMATAATPESDYNSNATTPGSRTGVSMLPSLQQQQQQQQHLQQHDNVVVVGGGGNGGHLRGGGGGRDHVGDGVGFCSKLVGGAGNNLNNSLASSHDFTHDNSDYQWFLDYGYRDGCGMQRSVLSSLSASYNGIGELLYYEDLAKNIDANLAEVDIDSFRAEDIHSLLSRLPSYCKALGGIGIGGGGGIGGAADNFSGKLQHSLMMQQHMPAHTASIISTSSTNELQLDNSICKSELLFSPVKESHLSVDSLDLDAYPDDGDIILTCKANKDNYTIAFEGSVVYSDESFYAEPSEIVLKNKHNFINLHSNLDDIVKRRSLEVSMSRSEHQQTTWSKSKKGNTLQRYPSGNNNTAENAPCSMLHAATCTVRKSSSLPNLRSQTEAAACSRQPLNVSHVSTSTLESCRLRNLLPMCQMPISCNSTTDSTSERLTQPSQREQQQQHQPPPERQQHYHHHHYQRHHHHHHHNNQHYESQQPDNNASNSSAASASSTTLQKREESGGGGGGGGGHDNASSSGTSATSSNQPAFNLVKLFIKQKSSSSSIEDHTSGHTCMDVSSGCWPSSDAAGSSGSSSSLERRLRKKSMNDSGKGSALSRHDEEELCCVDVALGESYVIDSRGRNRGADGVGVDDRAVVHKSHKQEALCDNDVFYIDGDDRTLTVSPATPARKRSLPLRHPQISHLAQHGGSSSSSNHNNNNGSSEGSLQSSNASRSNSEQLTQVYLSAGHSGGNSGPRPLERKSTAALQRKERHVDTDPRESSTSSEMITRSIQTSCGALSTRSSLSERFRFVPPSFLSKLNTLGEEKQAPIYVIYPNYALPDLGFVKTINTPEVIFSPFNFKASMGGGCTAQKERHSEDEILTNINYKHIVDWKSLATLLPAEYRKRLQHIPEVGSLNLEQGGDLASQKPLFCMSPPIRRPQRAVHLCDCAKLFQHGAEQAPREVSSSSGSSQQPSSGYRGSSTLLTDSELADTGAQPSPSDPLQPMYVYQYEQQRPADSTPTSHSHSHSPAARPTPQPRGILRKTATNQAAVAVRRSKRNSMFEEQHAKLTKQEKRRSLPEPAYQQHNLSAGVSMDELYAALPEEQVFAEDLVDAAYFDGISHKTNQRLSRKDLDARARAENFLSSLPRSELKYYAEIAAILESSEDQHKAAAVQYDAAALKKEVSRVLSQQKKVSFNEDEQQLVEHHQSSSSSALNHHHQHQRQQQLVLPAESHNKRFSTPPNSPNISMAGGGLRMPPSSHPGHVTRRCSQLDAQSARRKSAAATIDSREQMKIASNRFKRLQIQWELLSNDSSMMLKDLACDQETKSGGSTPTSAGQAAAAASASAAAAQRSRIPRPVSYPAAKLSIGSELKPIPALKPVENKKGLAKIVKPVVSPRITRRGTTTTLQDTATQAATARSPSRIVPPKRYSIPSPVAATSPGVSRVTTPTSGGSQRARTPTSRSTPAAAAVTAPNTPKRRVQSPRTIPRVR